MNVEVDRTGEIVPKISPKRPHLVQHLEGYRLSIVSGLLCFESFDFRERNIQ